VLDGSFSKNSRTPGKFLAAPKYLYPDLEVDTSSSPKASDKRADVTE
jgi:hypothetical protein